MPEPCTFPSLDSCQESVLRTHKEGDLALRPVVGLVLLTARHPVVGLVLLTTRLNWFTESCRPDKFLEELCAETTTCQLVLDIPRVIVELMVKLLVTIHNRALVGEACTETQQGRAQTPSIVFRLLP